MILKQLQLAQMVKNNVGNMMEIIICYYINLRIVSVSSSQHTDLMFLSLQWTIN